MDYPFAVRRATPADKESVVALARAIDPEDWVIQSYDGFMNEPAPAGLYLAEREGQFIGICLLELPAPGEAYLSALRIDPQLQGQGLGSFFVRAQVELIRASALRRTSTSSATSLICGPTGRSRKMASRSVAHGSVPHCAWMR